ncbi:phage tail protein [Escherichia coli]|nr:phage tail protein [Escherichia coli]
MDTTVGDFEYNWIGLLNEESGVLCMIAHTPRQQKIKTANGVQGNNLIRTFSMEFDGAAAAMHIDVSADVWQIDFTARLAGMDEAHAYCWRLITTVKPLFWGMVFRSAIRMVPPLLPLIGYVGGLRVSLREPYSLLLLRSGIPSGLMQAGRDLLLMNGILFLRSAPARNMRPIQTVTASDTLSRHLQNDSRRPTGPAPGDTRRGTKQCAGRTRKIPQTSGCHTERKGVCSVQ